jgi:hypothetical protein
MQLTMKKDVAFWWNWRRLKKIVCAYLERNDGVVHAWYQTVAIEFGLK